MVSLEQSEREPTLIASTLGTKRSLVRTRPSLRSSPRALGRRLEKAVFCVGSGPSYDGGIEPWQTGAWGQWDAGQKTMLNMTQQDFYINDTFGLKTLDESGRLITTIVPGASHSDWTGNEDLIKKWVLPHCT